MGNRACNRDGKCWGPHGCAYNGYGYFIDRLAPNYGQESDSNTGSTKGGNRGNSGTSSYNPISYLNDNGGIPEKKEDKNAPYNKDYMNYNNYDSYVPGLK